MKKPKLKKLIKPDKKRCQAERKSGSFMIFGPRRMVRCGNKPVCIATQAEKDEDGRKGSMSLCGDCVRILVNKMGPLYAKFTKVTGRRTK